MILKECMLIKNDVYVTSIPITNAQPTGIVVHSTGCNNNWLGRYVNPVIGQENYDEIIADIGKNRNGNHWNRSGVGACVHAFIGENDKGVVETYQTLPWDICCGGVANGLRVGNNTKYYYDMNCSKYAGTTTDEVMGTGWASNYAIKLPINGNIYYAPYGSGLSYNLNPNARIQFEIQEDSLNDEDYFNRAFKEAIEFCAYLCKKFNLTTDKICSHRECYLAGYGSGHVDPHNWLSKFGKDMDWFRAEVQKLLDDEETFELGDEVRIKEGVTTWASGKPMASWVPSQVPYYVRAINGNKITISVFKTGDITGTVWKDDITHITNTNMLNSNKESKKVNELKEYLNSHTAMEFIEDLIDILEEKE